MTDILIDTQAFVWFYESSPRLSRTGQSLLEDTSISQFFSVASLWELAILVSLSKLTIVQPFEAVVASTLQRNDISLLDISLKHATRYVLLPYHHRDPFDRLIVAQALCEQLTVVSSDASLDVYGVDRRW